MIYKFQPFSTAKELGREYNGHCSIVPKLEDWILILDYDTMVLTPATYKVIEAAIARYPDTAIFGARCNRVAYPHQRIMDEIDPDTNILNHIQRAKWFAEHYSDGECELAQPSTIAGFFMLFRKDYWEYSRFQDFIEDERGVLFDHNFCLHAKKNGLPIRIILGAYLWHTYRLDRASIKDKSHLKR